MKNRIFKLALVLFGASMVASSCIQEEFPYESVATEGQIGESTFASDGMVASVPAILVTNMVFADWEHIDFGYPGIMGSLDRAIGEVFPSNAYSGGNQYYDRFHAYMYHIGLAPNSYATAFLWYNYYKFIKTANGLIALCGDDEDKAVNRGIAKTFRALYYLDMARIYDALPANSTEKANYMAEAQAVEGLTVPIVTEQTTEESAANNPRATREEMFEFIFADLNDAEACLAEYTPSSINLPSLAVVYGLKARAYLWLGGFSELYQNIPTGNAAYQLAAKYARKAITASGATPLTEAQYCDPKTGFNTANNAWLWGLLQSTETVISNLHSWAAHMSCEAIYGYGGMAQPGVRKATFERMSKTDFRRKLIIAPDTSWKDYEGLTNIAEADWTTYSDEKKGARVYAHFKFRTNGGELNDSSTANAVDIPLMRVEEMYLIEAEATAHYNAPTGRQLLLSFVTAYRDPEYTIAANANLIDEIIFQKRVELWGEGILYYDFKRLDMGIHNAYSGHNTPLGADFEHEGRLPGWNYCIPLTEVQQNVAIEGKNNPDPSYAVLAESEK